MWLLYLLHSPRGATVFSHRYQQVIALTPHVGATAVAGVKGAIIVGLGLVSMLVLALFG